MLQPNRWKIRKELKGRNNGLATRSTDVCFGEFGLKATDGGHLTARQIESARRVISRHVKRDGRIFIRIFPDKPILRRPTEVWPNSSSGKPEYFVAEIQPGKVLFEINGVPEALAREAFTLAAAKLPLRCTFVTRNWGTAESRPVSAQSLREESNQLSARRSGLVSFHRMFVVSPEVRVSMLASLPDWALQQQASDVVRLEMTLGDNTETDKLLEFVCHAQPAPMKIQSSAVDGRFGHEKQYSVLGRFPSGVVRTVGTVTVKRNGVGEFTPFGYWSLLDPNDHSLSPTDTRKIETVIDIIAVKSF